MHKKTHTKKHDIEEFDFRIETVKLTIFPFTLRLQFVAVNKV